ncbi:sigma-70 family RNA polymerase sigma factor [Alteromonadaceae bacterium BrNp21-10]|nr:sigma-70 family RNA polymerase sigma factor [Alteromonadaceae bacterium BrNp21-10]
MDINRHDVGRVSDKLLLLSDNELVRIANLQLPYVTSAYEVLFHRYHRQLIQICFRYLNSLEEAEDAVSDTMLNVFNSLSSFAERSSFKTWIYRIAHNQSLDRLRKKKLNMVDMDEASYVIDEAKGVDSEYSGKTNQWLDTLSLEDRTIVVFRIAGDLEFAEIADIIEQKLSTVKMRYKRALQKMANLEDR